MLTPSGSPPDSMTMAVRLIWAGAALALVGLLVPLLQKDEIRRTIESENVVSSDIDTTINAFIAIAVVFGLIGCGLWVWMAIMNGKGRSWARIVATVFGSLNILFGTIGNAAGSRYSGATTISTVLSVCSVLLAVAIIVLMWQQRSSAWYDAMGRARQADRTYADPPLPS